MSGGGFRATLFHLGSVWRLNDLGYLQKLNRVCSVSGGSITAAMLGYRWKRLTFDGNGIATNFREEIAVPLRAFCSRNIDALSVLGRAVRLFKSLDAQYRDHLFGTASLQDLPSDREGPRFIIYATNLRTGASVRLSKPYVADYRVGKLEHPDFSLATAVAASSAFPPVLSPLVLPTDPNAWVKTEGADLYDDVNMRSKLLLTDGGVYDNLGLEAAWDFETVLVSDAGSPFPVITGEWGLRLRQLKELKRVLQIAMSQTRALRTRRLIMDFIDGVRKGTYWGIATRIDEYELPDAMVSDNMVTASLQNVRTRLNSFSEEEQWHLIHWGYALADAAMRRYVMEPGEVLVGAGWPGPREFALDIDS
jgi:NTE family protein